MFARKYHDAGHWTIVSGDDKRHAQCKLSRQCRRCREGDEEARAALPDEHCCERERCFLASLAYRLVDDLIHMACSGSKSIDSGRNPTRSPPASTRRRRPLMRVPKGRTARKPHVSSRSGKRICSTRSRTALEAENGSCRVRGRCCIELSTPPMVAWCDAARDSCGSH